MKTIIIDERKGDVIREDDIERMAGAELVLTIRADNHVDVHTPTPENWGAEANLSAEYIEGVHRDVISGEKSAAVNEARVAEREETAASHDPLDKAAAVWDDKSTSTRL